MPIIPPGNLGRYWAYAGQTSTVPIVMLHIGMCVCVCVCSSSRYGVQRSETSIKQMLLDWCRSKVKGYQVSWSSPLLIDVMVV